MCPLYLDQNVRQRLTEFMGGDSPVNATAACITHMDGCRFDRNALRPAPEIEQLLNLDLDVARSIADARSYLLHLDMEYVNFDSPAAAYTDPQRCFELQEPVVKAVESALLHWGIRPLHLMTGQGHHFVWRIGRNSSVARQIAALNPAPELIRPCLERLPPLLMGKVSWDDQSFFGALSLLMEFVGHRVKTLAVPLSRLPVEITAVQVPPSVGLEREMISIDISEYGDPLHTRVIRLPFTHYRKPLAMGLAGEAGASNHRKNLRSVPLHEMGFQEALGVRQDDGAVMELAQRACVRIPCQETGTAALLDEYLASRLRRFHYFYYSTQHDAPERWPETYDRLDVAALPNCLRHPLIFPNDILLKPACIRNMTRGLLERDWHPRHIGGLIRAKFSNASYGWGDQWDVYEPATRADFYTRLFAGLITTGMDEPGQYDCASIRESGFCLRLDGESCSLDGLRQSLLNKYPHY
jgi:hypothetical protein